MKTDEVASKTFQRRCIVCVVDRKHRNIACLVLNVVTYSRNKMKKDISIWPQTQSCRILAKKKKIDQSLLRHDGLPGRAASCRVRRHELLVVSLTGVYVCYLSLAVNQPKITCYRSLAVEARLLVLVQAYRHWVELPVTCYVKYCQVE